MTTNKKAAPAEAAQGATVNTNSSQSSTSDFLTVLTTAGPKLTKVFRADGSTASYDDAKSFTSKEHLVADIHDLSRLLTKLQDMPARCVIRGKLSANPEPSDIEGTIRKTNDSFDDCPHHWVMLDIDKFKTEIADPVAAVKAFLAAAGLSRFKSCSFHWQLSSSAGIKPGILKAHVWFWLEEPWTSAHLYVWAKSLANPIVDSSVFRRVQIHYTASPIFEGDRIDPVAVRSGFYQGERDTVPFAYDPSLVDKVARITGGSDTKLKDPSEKQNLIGAYHRAFPVEAVLMEHLEGMFEEGSTERRWTWLDGGGTPEGVWVADDRMHVGASHHTWPIDGLANLWDLVRVFKFGHLDKVEGDDFAAFDAANRPVHELPSQQAMIDWAETLPEVQAETQAEDVESWLVKFKQANNMAILDTLTAEVRAIPFSKIHRELLAKEYAARLKLITGQAPGIAAARQDLAFDNTEIRSNIPDWAARYVWSCEDDKFVNRGTKVSLSERSFNLRYGWRMQSMADSEGRVPQASTYVMEIWRLKTVDRAFYNPLQPPLYTMDGVKYLNLFRADLIKKPIETFTGSDLAAVEAIKDHLYLLIPDKRERELFTDYLSYCVQKPGRKIRWSPILKGIEGDGKTAFGVLLSYCLGAPNVRVLDSATLEKSDFTGWATGQCVTFIEELKLHGHNRHDISNRLKPLITNDTIEVHKKGKDPFSAPNMTNYVIFTNFADAMPMTATDRRYMPIWSPFSDPEELFGMIEGLFGLSSQDYFARLFSAMSEHADAIYTWLLNRELSPEFNPDGRAPVTSVRGEVIAMSVSDDEDAVRLLVEEQAIGVYPCLVSTRHLTEILRDSFGITVRGVRVAAHMQNLGFSKGKQVKWRGKSCRCYYKGAEPKDYQSAFEAAESERQAEIATSEMLS